MNKCVCDICCNNSATRKFKIKTQMSVVRNGLHVLRLVRLDACDRCYSKFMNLKTEQDLESRIYEFISTDNHLMKYDDADLQSAYLAGFQSVLDLLGQNKILK